MSSSSEKSSNSSSEKSSSSKSDRSISSEKIKVIPFTKLCQEKKEIKYIFHLSDIHIRNTKRHTEYKEVFSRTFEKIKSLIGDSKSCLIVVTGDVVHAKTELSPEAVSLTYKFFKGLSDLATVILIPGNHDCNLSNRQRMDALTPIVEEIGNLEKLHYLKNSGFYQYNNIIFGVTSIYDNVLIPADKFDREIWKQLDYKRKYKIALYHGAVHGAKTDVGYRMNHTELLAENFDGYDYVMLGDIHKFQYMDADGTIAYAGSLIQQSHGESLDNHGFIKWDLIDGDSQLVKIKNDYGFCTVQIENGEMIPTKIPLKPTICFTVKNTNELQYQKILKKLNQTYQICGYIKESHNEWIIPTNKDKTKLELFAYSTQEEIILKYLKSLIAEETLIEAVLALHKQIYKTVFKEKKINSCHKKQSWSIMELKFSNVLSYGRDNIIDFRDYDVGKIIGIMAPNHYGKSAILDIILFCLFDRFSRGERKDILNKNKTRMYCSLLFSVGNQIYFIERIGQRNKNGISVKIDVNFYKINDDEKENLNGIDKNETNRKITELIGDFNDYLTTCFCLQNGQGKINFLDMTHLQKKEYLHDILKLNVFEDCYSHAKDIFKELVGEVKVLEKQIGKNSLDELKDQIKNLRTEINHLDTQLGQRDVYDMICSMIDSNNPLRKIDELSQYRLETEDDIIKTTDIIINRIVTLQNDNIDLSNIIHKIKIQKEKLEIIEEQIKTTIDENVLDSYQKELETYLIKLVTIPDSHYKIDIDQLYGEKSSVSSRINEINISQNGSVEEDNSIDLPTKISATKKEINELKKSIVPIFSNNSTCEKLNDLAEQYETSQEKSYITTDKRKILECETRMRILFANHLIKSSDELGYLLKCHEKWLQRNDAWLQETNSLLRIDTIDGDKIFFEMVETYLTLHDANWNNLITVKIDESESQLSDLIKLEQEMKELETLRREKNLLEEKMNLITKQISQYESYIKHASTNEIYDEKIKSVKINIKEFKKMRNELYDAKESLIKKIKSNENIIDMNKTRIDECQKLKRHLKLLEKYSRIFLEWRMRDDEYKYWSTIKNEYDIKYKIIERDLRDKQKQLSDCKESIQQHIESRKEFDEKSEELNLYRLYLKLMDNNGLPYEILKNYLPLIEASTNQILHSIANFSVEFMFHDSSLVEEQKNKFMKSNQGSININIRYEDMNPLNVQLACGFEKFIIGLAIRMVLGHISLGAKPNFLIIDEGWSCLDNDNLNNIDTILDYIKMQYEHVIIISHLEELKNQVDYSININKNRGFSYVNTKKGVFI